MIWVVKMGLIKLLGDKKKKLDLLITYPLLIAAYLFYKAVIPFEMFILASVISAILLGFTGSLSFYLVNNQYFFQRELKSGLVRLSKIDRVLFIGMALIWLSLVVYLEYLAMTGDVYSAILSILYLFFVIEEASSLYFYEILRILFEKEYPSSF